MKEVTRLMNQKIELDGKTIGILQQDTVGYFNSDTPDSPFSNFYKTAKPFNLYFANGQLGYKPVQGAQKLPFSCVEQVFAYGKAVTMGDKESAKKIINAQSNRPSTYKYLGRAVKNFDATKWKIVAPKWMKLGMLAKFSQDDFAKRALAKVKNYKLGECNPYDNTWGLGIRINNNFALAMGQNKQGKILMQVAQELDQQGISGKEKQNEKQNTKADAGNTFTAKNDLTFADSFESKKRQSQQNAVSNQTNNRKTLTPINIDAVDPSLAQNNKEEEQNMQNNVTFF